MMRKKLKKNMNARAKQKVMKSNDPKLPLV